jgi:hypothetical protein
MQWGIKNEEDIPEGKKKSTDQFNLKQVKWLNRE